jgi:hypothetical protein
MAVLGTSLHCWNTKGVPLKIEFCDSMGSVFILAEIHVMGKRLGDLYVNWYNIKNGGIEVLDYGLVWNLEVGF